MATPTWFGAAAPQPALAGQINQFLATHTIGFTYTGVSLGSSTTLSGSATNSNGLYIAQQITPGSTQTVGRWILTLAVTGSPGALTFSMQSDNAGAPSGTVLATATLIPNAFVPGSAGQVSVPVPPTTIANGIPVWFVFNAVGDVSNFYSVSRTTAGSGASTSTNGTTWTSQSYGLYYQRFDSSTTGSLLHTYEDAGARWTSIGRNASTTVSKLSEYTLTQNAGVFQSVRSFTYTGANLTGVN